MVQTGSSMFPVGLLVRVDIVHSIDIYYHSSEVDRAHGEAMAPDVGASRLYDSRK